VRVRQIAEGLISGKKIVRGYLGVSIEPVNAGLASAMELESPQGALINGVIDNGPAQKGGLKYGDVVLKIDGKTVQDTTDLTETIAATAPGTRVMLHVWRDGQRLDLGIPVAEQPEGFSTRGLVRRPTLRPRDESEDEEPIRRGQPIDAVGVTATRLTPELAERLELEGVEEGVVIIGIDPTGDAYHAGLKLGDVIVRADRKNVRSVRELRSALSQEALEKGVRLLVRTSEGSRTVVLRAK
jgi:serine protease Do